MSNAIRTLRRMQKHTVKQVCAAIDTVLWEQWDPIGVNEFPEARAEYASYVNGVYTLLVGKAPDEDILRHLSRVETQNMGLQGSTEKHLATVISALRAINIEPADAP